VTSTVFPGNPSLRCIEAIYAVQLTVQDDKGDSSSSRAQVTVIEALVPRSMACG